MVADQSPLTMNARLFLDYLLQKSTDNFFIRVLHHVRAERSVSRANMTELAMSSRLQRVRDMKIFVELSLTVWTVLRVCLSSVLMTTLLLAVPQVVALMAGVPAAWACLT